LLAGGKRIRPILVLASAEVAGAPARVAMPFACGLEMIHTYSLVHDDLPAMDDDDFRRGRPTSHRVFGEGLAILVGDALLTEAFALMASARGVRPDRVLRAMAAIAIAAGETGMVGGQALDLAAEGARVGLATVRGIHRKKTGALLQAAACVGALVAGAPAALLRRLGRYGEHLGLAFQIVDDVLDATGTAAELGKTPGKDEAAGKVTYVSLYGLDRARELADQARARVGDRLEALRADTSVLAELVSAIRERRT
jgi:geranylgeranyl diphosphate synthase type II